MTYQEFQDLLVRLELEYAAFGRKYGQVVRQVAGAEVGYAEFEAPLFVMLLTRIDGVDLEFVVGYFEEFQPTSELQELVKEHVELYLHLQRAVETVIGDLEDEANSMEYGDLSEFDDLEVLGNLVQVDRTATHDAADE